MTAYAALLRGINVGGAKRLPMDQLRELLTGLGHRDVRTYLQSGNAVFTSDAASAALLAQELEAAIAARFGFEVRCLLRTGEELREVVERCPFPVGEGHIDPARLLVLFTDPAPEPDRLADIDPAAFAPEEFRAVGGREIYCHCPGGLGRSKLLNALSETRLGVTTTGRNWPTVTRLVELTR